MKKPLQSFLRKYFSEFNLFELILPLLGLIIGIGIVHKASVTIEYSKSIQFFLLIVLIESGSQVFKIYCEHFGVVNIEERNSYERQLLIILIAFFFGLSTLPLSQIFISEKSHFGLMIALASSIFISIILRYPVQRAYWQIMAKFLFAFNNSFLIPITQVLLYDVHVSVLFTTIVQVLFLTIMSYSIIEEIVKIEIRKKRSDIVSAVGTIPLLNMCAVLLIFSLIMLAVYVLNQHETALIVLLAISAGLMVFILYNLVQINQLNKKGLMNISKSVFILLMLNYIGVSLYLWGI